MTRMSGEPLTTYRKRRVREIRERHNAQLRASGHYTAAALAETAVADRSQFDDVDPEDFSAPPAP